MDLSLLPQAIVSGVLASGLYALVALGLAIAVGVIGIINLAQGEFLMIGAFLTFTLARAYALDPLIALLLVAPALFVLGAIVYRSAVQYVLNAPRLNQLLLTFGIAVILENAALLIWGGDPRAIAGVPYRAVGFRVETFLGRISVGLVPLGSFVISLALIALLYYLLARTSFGRAMRAVAQNRIGASLVGLEVNRIYLVAFALSAALAGLAGVMIAVIQSPTPTIGFGFTLKAVAIVIVAGLGNIRGILWAAMVVSLAESLVATLLPGGETLRNAVFFAIIFVVLIARAERLAA